MLDTIISFDILAQAGTQLEVVDDETALPGSCEEVYLLHLEMANKSIVSDFLDDFEGVDLNIPSCKLNIAL